MFKQTSIVWDPGPPPISHWVCNLTYHGPGYSRIVSLSRTLGWYHRPPVIFHQTGPEQRACLLSKRELQEPDTDPTWPGGHMEDTE